MRILKHPREGYPSKAEFEILRGMTPDESLQIIWKLWEFGRKMVYDMAKHLHPDWSEEKLLRYVAKRMQRDSGYGRPIEPSYRLD